MHLTVSLLDRRVSDLGESCALGCTSDIVSTKCAVHGFAVDKVRMVDTRDMTALSGESTLLVGIRTLDTIRRKLPEMGPVMRERMRHVGLQYVDSGQLVRW